MSPRTTAPFGLELLTAQHDVATFSSGATAMDAFLRASALAEQSMGLSSVTVALARRWLPWRSRKHVRDARARAAYSLPSTRRMIRLLAGTSALDSFGWGYRRGGS